MDAPEPLLLFSDADDIATMDTGPARIERRSLGHVELSDGKVYACDPLVPMDVHAFAQRLDPGCYEVILLVAVRTDAEAAGVAKELNAAAALVCSDERPVTWRRAAREGGDPEAGAYGVDSGTGCLMGGGPAESIFADNTMAGERIMAALEKASGALVALESGTVAAFRTGSGDGAYESWWGYDARGDVAMLLTDFGVVQPAAAVAAVHARWAKQAQKRWWQFWK